MQTFHAWVSAANGVLWGWPMLALLFGTHLFLTVRLRFMQRHIVRAIRLSFERDRQSAGDVSPFGSLATALAATIGTGNIVGVATALALGGPGAMLWMWLTGVFGIATKYGEALLAVKFRQQTSDGTMLGGPMYALEKGLGLKWLAVLFCVFTAFAAFGIGNMVQANSVASLVQDSLHVAPPATGLVMAALTAAAILGGVRSIAVVCQGLVPFMAVFYVCGCAIILVYNAHFLPAALKLIVTDAFSARAAGGGFIGASVMAAMRYGIARGLFSNESGLGSAPIVAAAARARNPVRQALVSATGTFWDTVVICAMSGLVLVTTILRDPAGLAGLKGATLMKAAFAHVPVIGPAVLGIGLVTFVFSTILGWSYYGERAVEYLLGKRALLPYRILWVGGVYVGAVTTLPLVWDLADAMNALMAIPNLVSLLLLSGLIVRETRYYLWENRLDETSPDAGRDAAPR